MKVEKDMQSWPITHGDTANEQTTNAMPLPDSEHEVRQPPPFHFFSALISCSDYNMLVHRTVFVP
jgi:hypothetical protein